MKSITVIAVATFTVFAPTIPASAAPPVIEYPIPTANSSPYGITTGPDGNLWFTEFGANKIGKITPSGVITEYAIPTPNSGPRTIAAGPDGNLWFTEYLGNNIGKITTTGVITEYPVPTANSNPYGIVTGPDGNLWFTEFTAPFMPNQMHTVGKITPSGTVTEYSYGTINFSSCAKPTDITVSLDGRLWFGGTCAVFVEMTTAGTVEFSFGVNGSLDSTVYGITNAPDGNLWGTLYSGAQPLSRIIQGPFGSEKLYTLSPPSAWPYGITPGPDGNVWFTEVNANNIGKITPSGAITAYTIPTANSMPRGITTGPDSNIWFTESAGNKIGKLVIPKSIVYTQLEPCRVMDTRSASQPSGVQGPIVGNTLYTFPGFIAAGSKWSLFGGNGGSDCGLNDTVGVNIQAIAMVVTILNPNFDSFLGISDLNDLNATLSTVALNYTAHQGLSTMYIVPQTTNNTIYFALPTGLSAQLIFDVVGYFATSDATALQCTTQASAPSTIGASGGTGSATSPSCATGYALTSGSCDSDSFAMKLVSDKASGQAWFCSAINSGAGDAHLTATANCCRVPGR